MFIQTNRAIRLKENVLMIFNKSKIDWGVTVTQQLNQRREIRESNECRV